MKKLILLGLLVSVVIFGSRAFRVYVQTPDDKLISESELIVLGKVTKIEAGRPGRSEDEIATITVREVIKGEKWLRTVSLVVPSGTRGAFLWAERSVELGKDGIWLLSRSVDGKTYTVKSPARFQPKEMADDIRRMVGRGQS